MELEELSTPALYDAFRLTEELLDMHLLGDPLQDHVYVRYEQIRTELYRRPDFEEIKARHAG